MAQNDNIQLFENKRIRTAWDEEKEEWYFSVVDVVAVLTDQPDYQAARNLNETRFSNIFIEKRVSSRLESLERSGLFLFAAFLYLLQNSQNSKLIFLCKVVI